MPDATSTRQRSITGSRATSPEHVDGNLRANLTVAGENPDTDYQPGLDAGLEYSLNYRLPKGWLIGLNGYLQQQLTDDEIDGATVNGDGQRRTSSRTGRRWPTAPHAGA